MVSRNAFIKIVYRKLINKYTHTLSLRYGDLFWVCIMNYTILSDYVWSYVYIATPFYRYCRFFYQLSYVILFGVYTGDNRWLVTDELVKFEK
jgi:hypothetical protein